jgi:signal transduction histidine kinase
MHGSGGTRGEGRRGRERRTVRRAARFLVLCGMLAGPPMPNAQAQTTARPKRVLILYSYSEQSPVNVGIDRGFRNVLQSERALNVEYFAEYLESDRFVGERQLQVLHDYLQKKYAALPIDVVVASSNASHAFLLTHRQTLFPDAPLLFLGGAHLYPPAATGPGSTGISTYRDYRKRLDLALRLHPETDQVFVISGTLSRNGGIERTARNELQGYRPDVGITYLTDRSLDELVASVKQLPQRSVILYTWQQSRNEHGTVLEPADILGAIAPVASAPIYAMFALHVGSGVVGGEVFSDEGVGGRAAQLAVRILKGERAQDIPVEVAPTTPTFDWRQVQRWGIKEDLLPPGSTIMFREPSVWERYRWYIVAASGIGALQAMLIVALLIQRASRKRAEQKAQAQQRELTHLSRVVTLGELTGTLAHEVVQPLSAILVNAHAARRLLERDTLDRQELQGALDDIVQADERATEVLGRVAQALRKKDSSWEELNLNDVVGDTLKLSAATLKARSVSVTTFLAQNLKNIQGDRVELQQVLLNLLLNACDAMSEVPAVRRKLTIRTETGADDTTRVSVTDLGKGISKELGDKIFNSFTTTKPDGLGLGLTISRTIIVAHRGQIWSEGNDGYGATFTFCIPALHSRNGNGRPKVAAGDAA